MIDHAVEVLRAPRHAWLELAACRGKPTAWWYPQRGDSFTAAVAKSICSTCPVRAECLADALATEGYEDVAGIRAGLSPDRRLAMARRLRAVPPTL